MSLSGSASNPIDVDSLASTTDSQKTLCCKVPLYRLVDYDDVDKIYRYNHCITTPMSVRHTPDEGNPHRVMCIVKVKLTCYGDLYVVQKLTVTDDKMQKPHAFHIESTKAIYYNWNTQEMTMKMDSIVGKSEMKYAKYYKNLIIETARETPLVCALARKDFKKCFGMSPRGLTREMYRELSFDINDMESIEGDNGYDPLCPSYCPEGAKSKREISKEKRDHLKKVIQTASFFLIGSANRMKSVVESGKKYSTEGAKASLFLDTEKGSIGVFVDFPLGESFFYRVKQWLQMNKPEEPCDYKSYSKGKMELSLYGTVYNTKDEIKFRKIEWWTYALPDNLCLNNKRMNIHHQHRFFELLNDVNAAWNDYALSDAETLLEGLTECKENLQDFFADNF